MDGGYSLTQLTSDQKTLLCVSQPFLISVYPFGHLLLKESYKTRSCFGAHAYTYLTIHVVCMSKTLSGYGLSHLLPFFAKFLIFCRRCAYVKPTSIPVQFRVCCGMIVFTLTSKSMSYQRFQYCPRSRIQPAAWLCVGGFVQYLWSPKHWLSHQALLLLDLHWLDGTQLSLTCPTRL